MSAEDETIVHMLVPVQAPEDEELSAIAACLYILEKNPRNSGVSHSLTDLQKERIVRYLAARYAP